MEVGCAPGLFRREELFECVVRHINISTTIATQINHQLLLAQLSRSRKTLSSDIFEFDIDGWFEARDRENCEVFLLAGIIASNNTIMDLDTGSRIGFGGWNICLHWNWCIRHFRRLNWYCGGDSRRGRGTRYSGRWHCSLCHRGCWYCRWCDGWYGGG